MIFAKDIKERLSIREVLEGYGMKFNNKGFALCPFHDEKTASLALKGDRFYCFGCGESGDLIDFVKKYFGLSFHDALKKINDDFSLDLDSSLSQEDKDKYNEQLKIDRAFKEIAEREKKKYTGVYDSLCNQLIGMRGRLINGTVLENEVKKYKERGQMINLILDDYNEGGLLLRAYNHINIELRARQAEEYKQIHDQIERVVDEIIACEDKLKDPEFETELNKLKDKIKDLSSEQSNLNLRLVRLDDKYTDLTFAVFKEKFLIGQEYQNGLKNGSRHKNERPRGTRS